MTPHAQFKAELAELKAQALKNTPENDKAFTEAFFDTFGSFVSDQFRQTELLENLAYNLNVILERKLNGFD